MNWLRRMLRSWLHNDQAVSGHPINDPLAPIGNLDNPSTLTVTSIENGFLVISRKFNPSGPDVITATFAGDLESLNSVLTSRLAHARLKM
jgi:hypothetical protein